MSLRAKIQRGHRKEIEWTHGTSVTSISKRWRFVQSQMSAQIIDKSSALYLNTETRLGAGQDFWVKVVPKIVARLPARLSLWTVSSLLMAQLFTTSCRWRRGGGGGGGGEGWRTSYSTRLTLTLVNKFIFEELHC